MENQNLLLLAQKVSKSEATVELAAYWQKRYELILLNNLFVLSDKTTQQIMGTDLIDRPSTPFGDLVLVSHLDANNQLDDIRLQATIETAVRFLDATLDILNFNEESRFIVNQYRKIGLGIFDIAQFLETKTKDSELDIIDHLGNLISNSSYRASETLAEEKKACNNWSQICKHLRPKSFELWFKENHDHKINGLALSEQYDSETILGTDYEIIPRRNSNLLLLPSELEWQLWSDRDESSPKTVVTPFIPTPPTINLENTSDNLPHSENPINFDSNSLESFELSSPNQEQLNTTAESFINSIDQPQQSEQSGETSLNTNQTPDNSFVSISQPEAEIDMSIFETLPENELQGHNLLSSDLKANLETPELEKLETTPAVTLEDNSSELLLQTPNPNLRQEPEAEVEELIYEPISVDQEPEQPEIELLPTHPTELLETESHQLLMDNPEQAILEPDSDIQPAFVVGELVKIVREGDDNFGKIYQVLDYLEASADETQRYRLIGGSQDVSNILWSETDLELVDLDVLLDEINLVADNDKSLENNLIDNLELELIEAENKILDLQNQIETLKEEAQSTSSLVNNSQNITSEEIINDYLNSDDFAEIIQTKVDQKIQELNLVPKLTSTRNSNQTISTLQMMRKYQAK